MELEMLEKEDLQSYKDLMDACFGGSNSLEEYEKYAKNEGYTIFVVKMDGKIVASLTQYAIHLFTFGFQPCLMLFNVAVLPEYRKQKIAQKLLRQVIEKARKDGYKSISLTCLDTAYPAHKLYESVGFTKAGSIKYQMDL